MDIKKLNRVLIPILIIIIIGLFVDSKNIVASRYGINVSCWATLMSSFITILGVYVTFEYERSQDKKEEKRNNLPFLIYSIKLSVFPYRKKQHRRKKVLDYKLSPKIIEYDCTLLIPIQVDNIGIGLAIITSITCFDSKNKIDYNCVSNETSRTKVIKKSGSSTFYIEIEGVDRKNLEYLNITVMLYIAK